MDFMFKWVDNDKELLNATYRLRYKIYCKETNFLNSEDYPAGIETDIYDHHALHFAALDPAGNVIGTSRLIGNSEFAFPLEEHCTHLNIDKNSLPRSTLAEVSRLSVSKIYRRRFIDGLYGVESYIPKKQGGVIGDNSKMPPKDIQRKRRQPVIIMGLYRQMYQESKRRGITHWYAAMEKKLWHSLNRFEMHLYPIGPEIDYYGPVTPYLGVLSDMERKLYKGKPLIMHIMVAGLEFRYWPKLGPMFLIKHIAFLIMARLTGNL